MIKKPSERNEKDAPCYPVTRGNFIRIPALQKVLVVGIGNEYRSDDGIGLVIARKIREIHLSSVIVIEESGEGTKLMEAWQGYKRVVLVDAILSGAKSGTIFKIDASKKKVPSRFFHYSTHAFSIAEAIELARVMKTLPPRFLIYGIEGANFNAGTNISQVVQESAKHVVEQIVKKLA
jgi:hydrogenase maturation protease